MATSVRKLAELLGGESRGNVDSFIADGQSIEKATPSDIVFVGDEAYLAKLKEANAGAVLLNAELAALADQDVCPAHIIVDDPQGAFIQLLEHFRPQRAPAHSGISADAHVRPSARFGDDTVVYPGAYIGDNVVTGKNCTVHHGVSIGAGCQLGNDVALYPGVALYPEVIIGDRVIIHASAVVGADGFGYRFVDGRHEKIPHFGSVQIGNDVEIGASATIDRGMIGDTLIGDGTKIDNLVIVAHNCEIGRHNAIAAQVGFAGSSTSGDYVVCGGQAGIADHVNIGARCMLAASTSAHKDTIAGETYAGIPAERIKDAMKSIMSQKKIPELRRTVRDLKEQVARLTSRLEALSETDDGQTRSAA